MDEALAALSKAKEAATARQMELNGLVEARAAVEARAKEVPRVVCQQLHGLFGQELPTGFAQRRETQERRTQASTGTRVLATALWLGAPCRESW